MEEWVFLINMESFLKSILNFLVFCRAVVMLILVRGTSPDVSLYKSILGHSLVITWQKLCAQLPSANSYDFVTF